MNHQTFAGEISHNRVRPEERWLELLLIFGLLLAALVLYTINLGNLPLRDWDEGTVAQVAKEIYLSSPQQLRWLFPTLWDQPYWNKPPLIHNLMALVYSFVGVNEFSSRIVGASLTACSVPLLYCLGRELFIPRYCAIFSALVYLTTLPVVRHGRLAMLDGAVLCFQILAFWCVLRSRRDLRWSLGVGISFGLICLSKGWMMGLLLGAIAFLFLVWDTPRLLSSLYLWLGLVLGTLPVIIWQTIQWLHYGEHFLNTALVGQSLERIYIPVEGHSAPVWYYLLELLKYPYPWIFLSFFGLRLAWQNRNWSWAKLILLWSGVYFVVVSSMMTKLPWYILPIYPALALAAGVALAEVKSLPSYRSYPYSWIVFFGLLGLAILGGGLYFTFWGNEDYQLLIILGLVSLTMIVTSLMIAKRDEQFIMVLSWGMYVGLILFCASDYWLWELNEAYRVKPVAQIIREHVPSEQTVHTSFAYERPSLNFYSEHKVIPASREDLEKFWQQHPKPYLLVDRETFEQLNLKGINAQIATEDFLLLH